MTDRARVWDVELKELRLQALDARWTDRYLILALLDLLTQLDSRFPTEREEPSKTPPVWLVEREIEGRTAWSSWRDKDKQEWVFDAVKADRFSDGIFAAREARLISKVHRVECTATEHIFIDMPEREEPKPLPYNAQLTIADRCPACSGQVFIGQGGHLTCSVLRCPDPGAPGDALREHNADAHAMCVQAIEYEREKSRADAAVKLCDEMRDTMQIAQGRAKRAEMENLDLARLLEHMKWCRSCCEGPWHDCEVGKEAEQALSRHREAGNG